MENGVIQYDFTIPGNTTALLYLPATAAKYIRENRKFVGKMRRGIEYMGEENGKILLKLQSGKYSFEVREKRLAKK